MTVLLLANVGSREVLVDRGAPISGQAHPAWNPGASRRALGQALLAEWDACRPFVRLPILGKAVDHVRQQAGRLDHVVLIASDQAGQQVAEDYLQQDTCELAAVVSRLLSEQHDLFPEAVTIWLVQGNPADYGFMQEFFRGRLPALAATYPAASFYLEVSGGTPAMTSMLLAVGAEVFQLQAYPFYIAEHADQPFSLDLGRGLVADSLQRVVAENARLYAYLAASRTVRDNLELLRGFIPADVLLAVLEYAQQRINFNFDLARQSLENVPPSLKTEKLADLVKQLAPEKVVWLLKEILFNAETRLRVGDYGGFLTRLFRFDEACLRFSARRLGARLVDRGGRPDEDGEYFDAEWLHSTTGLVDHLRTKGVRLGPGSVSANRFVLQLVIGFLAAMRGEPEADQLLEKLGRLNQLAQVRNKSFAVHTFDGVSPERIVQAFAGRPDVAAAEGGLEAIVLAMKEACALVTGQQVDSSNPYDVINQVIEGLLERQERPAH